MANQAGLVQNTKYFIQVYPQQSKEITRSIKCNKN